MDGVKWLALSNSMPPTPGSHSQWPPGSPSPIYRQLNQAFADISCGVSGCLEVIMSGVPGNARYRCKGQGLPFPVIPHTQLHSL